MLRRNSFRLPRHPASVGLARRRVREHLVDWGHKEGSAALEDIVLVVSELASNVVRHGPLLEREFEVEPGEELELEIQLEPASR